MQTYTHLNDKKVGLYYYSTNTRIHHNISASSIPLIINVLDEILTHTPVKNQFVIADYGCADGGVSLPLLYECVKKVKQTLGEKQEIQLLYEDLPTNDFLSLFKRLNGTSDEQTLYCLKDFKKMFFSAVGRSFFQQCFPSEYVHLAYSSMSMHWLSKRPCVIKDHIFYLLSSDEKTKFLFKQQAALDWRTIFLNRRNELVKGARFVLFLPALIMSNGTYEDSDSFNLLSAVVKQCVDVGLITQTEFDNTNMDFYLRILSEIREPFESNLEGLDLTLLQVEPITAKCPFESEWRQLPPEQQTFEKARCHIQSLINAHRPWLHHILYTGLSVGRSKKERNFIVNHYFERFVEEGAKSPAKYRIQISHFCIIIKRNDND